MTRDYAREEWANWQAVIEYMKQFETMEQFMQSPDGPDPNGTRFQELLDDWAVSRVRLLMTDPSQEDLTTRRQ